MKKNMAALSFICTLLLVFNSCKKDPSIPAVSVISGTGNIQDKLDAFRHLLGDQLNTTVGVTGGRREINWDGVPDAMLGKDLPLDFFNPTEPGAPQSLQRGLTYAAAGQFRVSSNQFHEVNSNASGEFKSFSGNKTFANVSSNAWEISIEKPGQHLTASTRGFGMVFSDIDLPKSTSVEFFNGNKSIGLFYAPPHDATSSFSFLGVYFNSIDRITRIRIKHDGILSDGQKDISANGTSDLVILDDLLYSEPVALTP